MALSSPFPPRPIPTSGIDIGGLVQKLGANVVDPAHQVFKQKMNRLMDMMNELEKFIGANPEMGVVAQSVFEAKFGKGKSRQRSPQDQTPAPQTPLAPGVAMPQPPMAGAGAAPPPPMRPAGL